MEPVRVTCHGCGADYRAAPGACGQGLPCPRCGVLCLMPRAVTTTLDPLPHDAGRRVVHSALTAVLVCALITVGVVSSALLAPTFTRHFQPDVLSADELVGALGPVPGVPVQVSMATTETSAGRCARPGPLKSGACPAESLTTVAVATGQLVVISDSRPLPEAPAVQGAVPPPVTDRPGAREVPAAGVSAPARGPGRRESRRPDPETSAPRRMRVRTPSGRTVIARVHGVADELVHLMLPDGQLVIPDTPAFTDQPFRPATAEEMVVDLKAAGFAGFKVKRTAHYLVLFESTEEFADESAALLENLYRGLSEAFRKHEIPVHEAEFPLVAVIFRTEAAFRAHKQVDPAVQAYYEIYTNRIFFYQTSEQDEQAPEVAAVRRPQTVAHEGTHQILQNIGIQPRLAAWPPWLVEGLAEFCATPTPSRRGPTWTVLGAVNAQHLATYEDLKDPLSAQVPGATPPEHIGRPPGMPLVEYLVTKAQLSPTDYALAWSMTHYLGRKRPAEFVDYLKTMSRMPPLSARTPADHLAAFRAAFGPNLVRLDREIDTYLNRLKVHDELPYYAVMFQQRVPGGVMNRVAIVSRSPTLIRQWLEAVTSPRGDPPAWFVQTDTSRTRAFVLANQFVNEP